MEQKYVYIGLALLVAIVLAFVFWPKPSVVVNPGASGGTLMFMGLPLSTSAVEGQDIECIGAPSGYTRAYFSKNDDGYELDLSIAYIKQGNDFDGAGTWVTSQASKCGYDKTADTSLNMAGISGRQYTFESPDGSKRIDATIALFPGSDGKQYTVIVLEYSNYYGEGTSTEENYDTGDSGSSPSSPPQDVPVTGALKEWDDKFRPILKSVFGEPVVLASVANPVPHNYGLEYALPRTIKADDSAPLLQAFTNAGWTQLSAEQDQLSGSFALQKGKTLVQVDYDIGGDVIMITVFEGE